MNEEILGCNPGYENTSACTTQAKSNDLTLPYTGTEALGIGGGGVMMVVLGVFIRRFLNRKRGFRIC